MERTDPSPSSSNQAIANGLGFQWPLLVQEAKRRRKEQNLTQQHLAEFVGISKPTLSRFEKGETDIQLNTALNILKALGIQTGT